MFCKVQIFISQSKDFRKVQTVISQSTDFISFRFVLQNDVVIHCIDSAEEDSVH